jgi:hypothetical protein
MLFWFNADNMKIVFLCGSLEPGRDGVGDYTRRLAGELINKQHSVTIIALYDHDLQGRYDGEQQTDGVTVAVKRLPLNMGDSERFKLIEGYIKLVDPDLVSLQFVPFSFNGKGLINEFGKKIIALRKYGKWHVMFHELWVGVHGETTFKHKILGKLQKVYINRFLKKLKPDFVTTTITIYKENILYPNVGILPLFGNIPIISLVKNSHMLKDNSELKVLHFGTFTSSSKDFEAQLGFIKNAAQVQRKTVRLIIIGSGGRYKNQAIEIAKRVLTDTDVIQEPGYLSFQEVSEYMQQSDLGISRADYKMFGKSGSTISMLEHGVPVVLRGIRPAQIVDGAEYEELLLFVNNGAQQIPDRKKTNPYLSTVGSLFIKYVENK